MADGPEFCKVTDAKPPVGESCLLYRAGDLDPVIGFRLTGGWILEEGGPEDGAHRKYPPIGGGDWVPTHYAPIRDWDLPTEGDQDA